ncbi:MAG TPA: class I SAM-dependent methyltransferase [Streptosporangiaceae bacterium]
MTADHYAGAGRRWATGATLVYGPIAAELVAMSPHPLAGCTVLDAGAGTGAVSSALAARRAHPIAMDQSIGMLAWNASARPPCVVADISALPLPAGRLDAAVAAFVLNHLMQPSAGLAELARVTRPGGAVLAAVFSNASRSQARDQVDAVAQEAGWQVPDWYTDLRANAVPILGTTGAMRAAANAAGLACVVVEERPVDVGVTEPEQLVSYRLGQPLFACWLDRIGPRRAAEVASHAADVIRPTMQPYRPIVVFLAATTPAGSTEHPDLDANS